MTRGIRRRSRGRGGRAAVCCCTRVEDGRDGHGIRGGDHHGEQDGVLPVPAVGGEVEPDQHDWRHEDRVDDDAEERQNHDLRAANKRSGHGVNIAFAVDAVL